MYFYAALHKRQSRVVLRCTFTVISIGCITHSRWLRKTMPSVTVQGAGSVYPTLTAGTNAAITGQAAALINNAMSNPTLTAGTNAAITRQAAALAANTASFTATAGGTAPEPKSNPGFLVVNTNNQIDLNFSSSYPYVLAYDNAAPSTLSGGGAVGAVIVVGAGTVRVNTGGGSGSIYGGDGDKSINLGTTSGFAVYTGAGHDTIDLSQSLLGSRNTVEAGAGDNVINAGAITQPGNTILLGAGAAQVRSTGSDSVNSGAGSATIQVVGSVQDTVVGSAGTLTLINSTVASTVNYPTTLPNGTTTPLSSGSVTALGGAGGGYYRGGSNGSNLLVGSLGSVTLQGGGTGDVLIAMGGMNESQVLYAGSGNETLLGSLSTTGTLYVAGNGNDVIIGGSGADTFVAGTGAATITSGAGPDLFMFNAGTSAGAQLTITDFTPGVDHLRLTNYSGPNTPSNLAANATQLGTAGSRITLSDGTTITFQGVSTVNSGFFG